MDLLGEDQRRAPPAQPAAGPLAPADDGRAMYVPDGWDWICVPIVCAALVVPPICAVLLLFALAQYFGRRSTWFVDRINGDPVVLEALQRLRPEQQQALLRSQGGVLCRLLPPYAPLERRVITAAEAAVWQLTTPPGRAVATVGLRGPQSLAAQASAVPGADASLLQLVTGRLRAALAPDAALPPNGLAPTAGQGMGVDHDCADVDDAAHVGDDWGAPAVAVSPAGDALTARRFLHLPPETRMRQGIARLPHRPVLLRGHMHPRQQPRTAIPLGYDHLGNERWLDLTAETEDSALHIMVAGMPNSGKSAMLRSWMYTLTYRCSPEDVQFLVWDGKTDWTLASWLHDSAYLLAAPFGADGMTIDAKGKLTEHSATEHLRGLVVVSQEIERRTTLLKAARVLDREAYLRKTGQPMPLLVCIFDDVMGMPKEVEQGVKWLTAKGRNRGVRVWVTVQTSSNMDTSWRATISTIITGPTQLGSQDEPVLGIPPAGQLFRPSLLPPAQQQPGYFVGRSSGEQFLLRGAYLPADDFHAFVQTHPQRPTPLTEAGMDAVVPDLGATEAERAWLGEIQDRMTGMPGPGPASSAGTVPLPPADSPQDSAGWARPSSPAAPEPAEPARGDMDGSPRADVVPRRTDAEIARDLVDSDVLGTVRLMIRASWPVPHILASIRRDDAADQVKLALLALGWSRSDVVKTFEQRKQDGMRQIRILLGLAHPGASTARTDANDADGAGS